MNIQLVGWLCWGLTSQSTIFQSCRDGAIASWVINQYFRGVKCLAQGHNTAAVGFEPRTSRSGVRHSTTEPPRSPEYTVINTTMHNLILSLGNMQSLTRLCITWYYHLVICRSDSPVPTFFPLIAIRLCLTRITANVILLIARYKFWPRHAHLNAFFTV